MMEAYKRWYDQKYYIHKDTVDPLNVIWTNDIKYAKKFDSYAEAIKFCCDFLGFSIWKTYDPLYIY
jgi:hypothetical protein